MPEWERFKLNAEERGTTFEPMDAETLDAIRAHLVVYKDWEELAKTGYPDKYINIHGYNLIAPTTVLKNWDTDDTWPKTYFPLSDPFHFFVFALGPDGAVHRIWSDAELDDDGKRIPSDVAYTTLTAFLAAVRVCHEFLVDSAFEFSADEVDAERLKARVANGIEIAYEFKSFGPPILPFFEGTLHEFNRLAESLSSSGSGG